MVSKHHSTTEPVKGLALLQQTRRQEIQGKSSQRSFACEYHRVWCGLLNQASTERISVETETPSPRVASGQENIHLERAKLPHIRKGLEMDEYATMPIADIALATRYHYRTQSHTGYD